MLEIAKVLRVNHRQYANRETIAFSWGLYANSVRRLQSSKRNKSSRMLSRRNNQSNYAEPFVLVPKGYWRAWVRLILATGITSCLTLMGKLARLEMTLGLPDTCKCGPIKRRAFSCMAP